MVTQYIILILYFFVLLAIGYYASKKIHSIDDYYVGGKKLGFWVVAFSSRATGESAWLLLGLTGMGAMAGVSAFWVVVGEVIGVSAAWFLMAKPFKKLTNDYKSITIPDYLVSRFKSKTHTLRKIAAALLSFFVVIYVSAQIDATGSAFEAFLGWDYYTGAIVGFLIVLTYIFSGGFVAVAWSDLFQGLLMLFGLLLLPTVAWYLISEPSLFEGIRAIDPELMNIWGAGGLTTVNIFAILGFMMIGLGFMGSPQLFVRFMSIKDVSEINKGRWVAIGFTILTDSAAVMVGIIGRYYFSETGVDIESTLGNGAQNVLSMLVSDVMPTILVGLYVAVVLSAIMSTIDSLLVVASSAITRDYYQQIMHPDADDKTLTSLSRKVTIIMALIALTISLTISVLSPDRTIFWFVIFGWSGIAATFCPVMILSLFWKGYTEKGAIASMITGFLCVPLFKFGATRIPEYGILFEKMDVMLPSFLFAMLAGFIISKLDDKQQGLMIDVHK
ncbi:MAG: sodium/proline symporter [Saprospiraceae bacterium]|nr:sodium/proline symporter [Saprospiraceae bacterium]